MAYTPTNYYEKLMSTGRNLAAERAAGPVDAKTAQDFQSYIQGTYGGYVPSWLKDSHAAVTSGRGSVHDINQAILSDAQGANRTKGRTAELAKHGIALPKVNRAFVAPQVADTAFAKEGLTKPTNAQYDQLYAAGSYGNRAIDSANTNLILNGVNPGSSAYNQNLAFMSSPGVYAPDPSMDFGIAGQLLGVLAGAASGNPFLGAALGGIGGADKGLSGALQGAASGYGAAGGFKPITNAISKYTAPITDPIKNTLSAMNPFGGKSAGAWVPPAGAAGDLGGWGPLTAAERASPITWAGISANAVPGYSTGVTTPSGGGLVGSGQKNPAGIGIQGGASLGSSPLAAAGTKGVNALPGVQNLQKYFNQQIPGTNQQLGGPSNPTPGAPSFDPRDYLPSGQPGQQNGSNALNGPIAEGFAVPQASNQLPGASSAISGYTSQLEDMLTGKANPEIGNAISGMGVGKQALSERDKLRLPGYQPRPFANYLAYGA